MRPVVPHDSMGGRIAIRTAGVGVWPGFMPVMLQDGLRSPLGNDRVRLCCREHLGTRGIHGGSSCEPWSVVL